MKKLLVFAMLGFLAGGLVVGAFARVENYPITIFGRRLSPAWIKFDRGSIGASDVKKLYDRIQNKEEFHAIVLMSEVHAHFDPWAILGCKMALRAMELLDAGYVGMTIVSEAGDELPLGGVTDGMSIGSSCTVGLGLLKLGRGPVKPAATFIYEDRAMRLEARPAVVAAVRDSMLAIEEETGGPDYAQYWMQLRVLGLEVWEQWDQGEIFEEAWVDPSSVTAVEDALVARPQDFSLSQNRPNPFNAATSISFSLPRAEQVELEVYNTAGQKVRTLLRGQVAGGPTSLTWDGRDEAGQEVAGGIYFYRLVSGEGRAPVTRKMCLLK